MNRIIPWDTFLVTFLIDHSDEKSTIVKIKKWISNCVPSVIYISSTEVYYNATIEVRALVSNNIPFLHGCVYLTMP